MGLRSLLSVCLIATCAPIGTAKPQEHLKIVEETEGLVAFWDFNYASEGVWHSRSKAHRSERAYPVFLRRIGDPKRYRIQDWPYHDEASKIILDESGPFGKAVRFNRGYVYGSVPREEFDRSLLDLRGRNPFTIIAWVKFIGERHMIAGIWDEGGWDKYGGRRQVALFAGLFGQKGAIAHVSATGASSFPQSEIRGSQYARIRAIDGQPFEDGEWVSIAATFDPASGLLTAYLDGVATPLKLTDPVTQDAYGFQEIQRANPFRYTYPIFSPRSFVLKFNGYNIEESGVAEHRILIDLEAQELAYERAGNPVRQGTEYRVLFDVKRDQRSILDSPVELLGRVGANAAIPFARDVAEGDNVVARLEEKRMGRWYQIGNEVIRPIQEGAPFTFGRALGLGSEELNHGSQIFLDGVAVFDRVLSSEQLKRLSFRSTD